MLKIFVKLLLLIFVYVMFETGATAQNHSLSGYVLDAQTGEALIAANVFIEETGSGTTFGTKSFMDKYSKWLWLFWSS